MTSQAPSFTNISIRGIERELITDIHIFNTVKVKNKHDYNALEQMRDGCYKCLAVWDTGATNSSISGKIVDALGLPTLGVIPVRTANGTNETTEHMIDIGLPNKLVVPNLLVSKGNFGADANYDVLIGMDVITRGDFAVSNFNGKTAFTFRIPSMELIDYVHNPFKIEPITSKKISRNSPCPCGSGKKYKQCCGK